MNIPPVPHAVLLDQRRRKEEYARDNPAVAVFEQIKEQVHLFGKHLEDGEALGIQLLGSGSEARLKIQTIGYATPSIIYFDGETADGNFARLLQNVSQLSVMLVAVTLRAGEEKRPIGFVYPESE